MQQLLGCCRNDDLVETADRERQAALYALAHMLADAWRVLTSMPRLNADNARATIEVLAKTRL